MESPPERNLFVGFDVGSSFVHCVVLDSDKNIVYSPKPIMHFADPHGAIKEAWQDITKKFKGRIKNTAFTGSGAESFPKVMKGVTYDFDSVTIPKGGEIVSPEAKYIFHMGAKDSYLFELGKVGDKKIIQEWKTGTKCGGGSGTSIEKQCRRLFEREFPAPKLENILTTDDDDDKKEDKRGRNRKKLQLRSEEMFSLAAEEAVKSEEPSEFLARCGVVIQSDLIHKQNEGAKREDNLAGLFKTTARNYKIDVLGTRKFSNSENSKAIVIGGVFTNSIIKENLEKFLGISVKRPENYFNIAAVGIALKGIEENNNFIFKPEQLEKVSEYSREKRQFAPPLSDYLENVIEKSERLEEKIEKGTEVVIGIDGGSTTTKGALVELETGKLLDKLYIKTHGNPEKSLKDVIEYLSRHKDNVVVKGVGATGSARKLYEKILISKKRSNELKKKEMELTDKITDEITCHAFGVKHHNPKIDTIFEIGGQDMKFTRFAKDGTVKEAKMNYSCQAGSGQTLENMADIIGLNVRDSLQEAALKAKRVPIIDFTCGVFMEMDVNRLIAEGFSKEEIAAAIVRGTAASYFYKFVGGSNIGEKCSAQGGPPLGKAFLAALAQVTNKKIYALPHREMFGAWGQALDIVTKIKQLKKQDKKYASAFRGWDIPEMELKKKKIYCRDLLKEESCGVRNCLLEEFLIGDDKIITGGFCGKGNSEVRKKPTKNYVEKYHEIFNNHLKNYGSLLERISETNEEELKNLNTVGIKRSTATLGEKGIWSAALFRKLGFWPVVSPKTDKKIAQTGIDNSRTDFCIARKIATGHAKTLNDNPRIKYLFNPSFIEQRERSPPNLKYCIYTESEGYVLNNVLSLDKNRQINPILHFGDKNLLVESFKKEFNRLGFKFTNENIGDAITYADNAERDFKKDLYKEGDKFLEKLEKEGKKGYVGLGRDYVLLDPEASSDSGFMFSQVRGLDYIPQNFLEHKFKNISLEGIAENEFWIQSVKILKAGLFVAAHPNLFSIRLSNFGCGPDSLKIYQESEIQEAANKPLLVLSTDAQTNNAPFITRIEAHERVVEQYKPKKLDIEKIKSKRYSINNNGKRTWLIPYMGDSSLIGAASLKHFGVNAEVLPTNTKRGYTLARKHLYTEVCHPLKGVLGDVLGFLEEEIEKKGKSYIENNYLVMLPTTSGPCRFGKYTEVVRKFMNKEGLEKIPVVGPTSKTDYFDVPLPRKFGLSNAIKLQKILFKGIKAESLLEDITRRFRPYASDKQEIDNLKKERLNELEEIVKNGAKSSKIIKWGKQTVDLFEKTNLQNKKRFPLVLYTGEIYMRHHDPYTNNVINKLEEKNLEMVRDPVTDWLFYVNKINQRNSRRDIKLAVKNFNLIKALKEIKEFTKYFIKGRYMKTADKKIAQPFEDILYGRHLLPEPIKIINTLEENHEYHGDIEGESPLSSGIAYYLMYDKIKSKEGVYCSGNFHVGPFTCMQEGVATAEIEAMAKELRKKKPDLVFPRIHASFGDSPNPNLDAEIAVFREQCYQKREILKEQHNRN